MNIDEKSLGDAVRLVGDRLLQVHTCENDRGTPGTGHVQWAELFAALRDIGFDGPLVIESFTPAVKEIAKAVSLWRPLDARADELARRGAALPARVARRPPWPEAKEQSVSASRHDRPRASGPSSSRSTSGTRTPTCTPSASATEQKLDEVGDAFGIAKRYTDYRRAAAGPGRRRRPHQLADPRSRAAMSLAALKAGKHVMCTVPMATSIEDCQQIVELGRSRPA